MTARRLLVAGATGFVGRPLVERLVAEGHTVRAMTRQPDRYDGPGQPVAGDVSSAASLEHALDGIEVAYYLVHSLDSDDFEQRDARAAEGCPGARASAPADLRPKAIGRARAA